MYYHIVKVTGENDNTVCEIDTFCQHYVEANSVNTNVDELWSQISTELNRILDTMVPSRLSSARYSQPWINQRLKALSRRKKRAYKKARWSKKTQDWTRYKNLKKSMQRECRSTYHSYINDMLCEEDGNPERCSIPGSSSGSPGTGPPRPPCHRSQGCRQGRC